MSSVIIYLFFVNAEAVPKKILDLMNVENITRENVASHLQVQFLSIRFTNFTSMSLTFICHMPIITSDAVH